MRLPVTLTKPQADFLQCSDPFPAFVGGFGSGKSQVLGVRAIGDAAHGADALVAIYAPTYDLLRLVNMGRIETLLDEFGISYQTHTQDKAIYTSRTGMGDFIFRTLDNPERIVGFEAFRSHVDELDTLKTEHARAAWNKVIGRNRQKIRMGARNQVCAYTTPEGFRFTHDRWVVNGGNGYTLFKAPTYSNPFLTPEYIENLRSSYPGPLIEAYIEGDFVNLTSGTVYSSYDRARCRSDETIRPGEPVFVGQDFNVGAMASVILVRRPDGLHAVDEIMGGLDTPWLIDALQERFPGRQISVYPDASGKSRKTVDASKSDIRLLRNAGFRVVVNLINPPVRDRVVSVNHAFSEGKLWINDRACPVLAQSLEQQGYASSGEPDKDGGHDHANDALGYVIAKEMPVRAPEAPSVTEAKAKRHDYGYHDDDEDEVSWKVA